MPPDPTEGGAPSLLDNPERVEMPRWVEPMLATLVDEAFSDPGWVSERKLDGQRCLAFSDGDGIRLLSRNRKRQNATPKELAEALAGITGNELRVPVMSTRAQRGCQGERVGVPPERRAAGRSGCRWHENQIVHLGPGPHLWGQNVIAPGQSGDATSPHFDDQLELYPTWQYKPMRLTRADLNSHTESTEHLRLP